MFVVPCEGSEAEALKYMRGVNLAWVARASLSEGNRFGPAAASLALPAQQPGVRVGSAWAARAWEPSVEWSAKSGLGLLRLSCLAAVVSWSLLWSADSH